MRLILLLKTIKDQAYDTNYNYHVQSFIYNLIKNTEFRHLHDFKGISTPRQIITPFCFSNIFPYGYMKQGQIRFIIISSPSEKFIFLLYNKIRNMKQHVHFGNLEFDIIGSKAFELTLASQVKLVTMTPIIIRIPKSAYQGYDIKLKHPYQYIFWRQTYPLELFLNQLQINLKKKFINYNNREPDSQTGYKSITVSENVYKHFFKAYEKNKEGLEIKGIRSFSGYLTSMKDEMLLRNEAFARHATHMEKLSIDQNRVVLKDNKRNRIAEVMLKEGELQCLLDNRPDCVHVGFVYSLPELYNMNDKEIKAPPRSAYGEIS